MKGIGALWILLTVGVLTPAFSTGLKITEVLFNNKKYLDEDGNAYPWVEIKNFGPKTVLLSDYTITNNLNLPLLHRLPEIILEPGNYIVVWFSGKNKIEANGQNVHVPGLLDLSDKAIAIYNTEEQHFTDIFTVENLPGPNQSVGKFPETGTRLIIYDTITMGKPNPYIGKWQLLAKKTNFSPRDNSPNACLVYKDQMWILAGEVRDQLGIWDGVTDVWSSYEGTKWILRNAAAPYRHISSFVVFKNKMWAFDGNAYYSEDGMTWTKASNSVPFTDLYTRIIVFNDHLINITGQSVYKSSDGVTWEKVTENAPWDSRKVFHLIAFKNKIYFLGGVSNYGTAFTVHYNDIWVSESGSEWSNLTENAPWEGRLWPSIAVYDNKLWLMGGWSYNKDTGGYLSNYGNQNDVWYTENGLDWIQLVEPIVWLNRHASYSMIFQDNLYLFAGYGGGGISRLFNDAWVLDLREFLTLAPENKSITYGDAGLQLIDPGLTVNYFSANDTIISINNERLLAAGAGRTKILISYTGGKDYYPADTIVEVSVSRKQLLVTADDVTKKFGEPMPELQITYSGFANGDDDKVLDIRPAVFTIADSLSPRGQYAIDLTKGKDKNYDLVLTPGVLTVEEGEQILLYPNPTDGFVNIVTDRNLGRGTFQLYNEFGQQVKTIAAPPNENQFTFDLHGLPPGLYIFRLDSYYYSEVGKIMIR
jgi:hypothetical protein